MGYLYFKDYIINNNAKFDPDKDKDNRNQIKTTIGTGNIGSIKVNFTQNTITWSGNIYPYYTTEKECSYKYHEHGICDKTTGTFANKQSTTNFTDDQIKRIGSEMSDISYDLVEGIKVCTLDETIYTYILDSDSNEKHIQNNNKSPVMCIPRKPHANRLLTYMVGTFLERIHFSSLKKPRIKILKRFLNELDNEITPSSRVDHLLETYKDLKFDLVGDSAFFPKDNLNHIVNKDWLATISDSSSSNINTILKDTLKDEKSWIAIELDGYYKVCKIDERDEKVPTFKSIATGFKTQNRIVNPSKCYNNSDAVDLYKLNNSTLEKLCLGLGVSRSSSNKRMVMSICAPAQSTCEGYILAKIYFYSSTSPVF
ncbi:hypothetical protein DICPUDRAFT_148714 [Dictyostelium purpureum]|uniref:Uncharacterized protein n=1 Tax=Dictyostelium purpureum TaxID=5786 RepID=F0ZBT7_DICPU|nr:uncharacterized protein DICPUDRAFT_148714 [Dictyostelium purpureum]EGC38595.1 hypothetical protein DICPUDRAFT_148714 [Dictyostelium purpureum]|eukprot:XP_003284874.1 hypothetical protein DICPUDRAFT_148714 [Dictyostelium purpureum]